MRFCALSPASKVLPQSIRASFTHGGSGRDRGMNFRHRTVGLAGVGLGQMPQPPLFAVAEDADQDGMPDVDELVWGLDPLDPADGLSDDDGDGLSLAFEYALGTAPSAADSDGDGLGDGDEVLLHGSDPLDPLSPPQEQASGLAQPTSNTNIEPVATSTSASLLSATAPPAPPPPSLANGDFNELNSPRWILNRKSTNYQGGGFDWFAGSDLAWDAYRGSTVEVWKAKGEQFAELDGDTANYGIKQPIANVRSGSFILTWLDCGRNNQLAGTNSYKVIVYYLSGATEVPIAGVDKIGNLPTMKWNRRTLAFQIKPEHIAAANGGNIYVAFVPLEKINGYGTLIDKVSLLPVEVVQGELGTESEDVGNWLMTEADPKPEVEMEITDAVVSGTDVIVSVQGTVTDRLSKFGETAAEKVQTLKFIVDGQTLHSINVADGVEDGFAFNETVTIPNAKPRGYTLRAETTENAAGNTGWDQVAVGLNLSPSATTFPSPGSAFRIAFSQNPTNGQIDSAQVFFGDRGIQAGDLTVTETAADSYQFAGQVKVTIDGQQQSVPCQLAIRGPLALAAGAIDELTAEVSYTVPGLGENRLHGMWKESAANSLLFASSGYQAADETILVEAMVNLPGSQQEDFEPITMRISGPDDWEDSETVKIKVGDTEYPLKKFTFDGKESLYPYDEAYPDEPKQFLLSAKAVPQKLETPGYTAGGGSFDFKLKIDDTEHDIQTVQVQRGFRDDFFAASPPLAAAQAAPLQAAQAQAAEQGWREPGDKVTMTDLLTAHEWIYGTDEDAMTLLRAFQENGNIITLGNELGDLDVNYILRTDNKIEIEIEDDDNDVNPIVCANLLHAGLYKALAYPPLNTHPEILDNINLFIASRQAFAQTAAEITATAAEMYLSGITIVNEGLDWVLVINDVAEGQYASLAAALPLVPVAAVRTGGKMVFRTPGGRALGEIADQDQLDAIYWASKKRSFEDKIAILEDAGLSDDIIDFLVCGGEIQYAKAHATLKNRMIRAGDTKPGIDYEAHHDLPWEFREWFAAHKIDVNDAQYGRWVHIDDHKTWHNENPKFNEVWEDFIYDANGRQVRRSKDEILAKLNEIRAAYPE
jgi:hypothetical protein